MKTLVLFACVLMVLHTSAQQSTLKGIVSIQNSETLTGKRQYVSNAQVEDDFGKANPRVTDNQGQFGLVYVGVAEKASVSFQVKKPGLQVVDPTSLSAVAGQQSTVKITMAHPDSIAEYRRKIFKVGKTEAEKRLESLVQSKAKELADARKNSQQDAGRIKKLQDELTYLEGQRQKIAQQAEELARKYAAVNLDDASALFRQAFVLFQNGHLDSAYSLLQQANLAGKVDSILVEREKISIVRKELQSRDSVAKQRTADVAEALQLKIDLHKTRYEFDSASNCYELLIRLDTSTGKYLLAYSKFLGWLTQYEKAIRYCVQAVEVYRQLIKDSLPIHEPWLADALNHLGTLYTSTHDFSRAEAALLEALEIRKRLAKNNPQTYERRVADVQNNLGNLYLRKNDFPKSEGSYLEALGIFRQLAKNNPQVYNADLADIQQNLGSFYTSQKDYVKAEAALLAALDLVKQLIKSNPQTYEPQLAAVLNNLGDLYRRETNFSKAESALLESLNIRKRLSKENPQTYKPETANTQNNLANVYSNQKKYSEAEASYLEALGIWTELAKENPQVYDPALSMAQFNLGIVYNNSKDYSKAEDSYLKALDILTRLDKNNARFIYYVAITKGNLGHVYIEKKDYTKAEALLQESIKTYTLLAKDNPKTYEPDIVLVQNDLGILYTLTNNYDRSLKVLHEAFDMLQKWIALYPQVYTMYFIEVASNITDLYLAMPDSLVFNPSDKDSLKVPEDKLYSLAKTDTALSKMMAQYYSKRARYMLSRAKTKDAVQAATKGLELDSTSSSLKAHLADALLLDGRYDQALKIFEQLKSLKDKEGKPYAATCLEELNALEKKGITNKDVDKVRALLQH
ncbi:MAG: tetratricopeptide repeat protein [Williamsia sp.]|nr:tetratricopeptide repeat protein [Williamsia sp.]